MLQAEERFKVLLPPPDVWKKISDCRSWGAWLEIPRPTTKGLGETFAVLDGEGASARVGMFHGQDLLHVWETVEWFPPERVRVRLREWNADGAARALASAAGSAPANFRFQAKLFAQDLEFSISVAPGDITKATSEVTVGFSAEFTHSWAFLFSVFIPRSAVTSVLRGFSRRFLASLEVGGTAA